MNTYTFTPADYSEQLPPAERHYVLYDAPDKSRLGSTGTGIVRCVMRAGLRPNQRAWDLLSIALSVVAADRTTSRSHSPDGWTRHFKLTIAVRDIDIWLRLTPILQRMLRFLTTDIWDLDFIALAGEPPQPRKVLRPPQDAVVLISGGLDSLVGAIDLKFKNIKSFAVSQTVRGEADAQTEFVKELGIQNHLQFNHNSKYLDHKENSSRARSILFLAFGTLVATSLHSYKESEQVPLYVCENGFISLNPPLTPARIGSLSTRTTHPTVMAAFQKLLDESDIRVELRNPYQYKTKGEMLRRCADQNLIKKLAYRSISCGKYRYHKLTHCGRCLPCLIRRGAFLNWGKSDRTTYKFANLSLDNDNHARFDDVRSAAMAIAKAKVVGASDFLDSSLFEVEEDQFKEYLGVVERGLLELEHLLLSFRRKW